MKKFFKTKKGFIEPRMEIDKRNPLLDNPDIHSVIEVTGNAKGSRYKAYKLRKGYLLIGAGNDKWINGEK